MQRVLSSISTSEDKKPSFSQIGLAIPERDKLQMKVNSRKKVSFSWAQAEKIADHVGEMATLGEARGGAIFHAVSSCGCFRIGVQ